KIDLCKLDDYFFEKPTFIKMDIEGAELDCLKGAERILRELKPKLAICLYHKPFDIFEIPFYLKKIVPEYTFKIRQHQRSFADLVLYASA
ncbi:MAG: FkbM family methyltransferase, partial [Succinivibrio sp.]